MSAAALLAWYDRHRRKLPWRRDTDPYRVWISEIMLQQTRVETVLAYYERFLDRFPDVHALAAAPLDEVLALWSGLGYYRRARQLHAAAAVISRQGYPRDAEGWRRLPGIGEYTSAAVASIAFGEAVPVLDGNVERVTARLLALPGEPKRAAARRRLRAAAAELLDPRRPGDGNQALMELGARICTPRKPRCMLCPLEAGCEGRRSGDPERFPAPRERRAPRRIPRTVALVEGEGGRWLLFRRPEGEELLAGFWELPWTGEAGVPVDSGEAGLPAEPGEAGVPTDSGEAGLPASSGEAEDAGDGGGAAELLAARYGGRWRLEEHVGRVHHGITHRVFELDVYRARVEAGPAVAEGREARWATEAEVERLPTSSMVEKVLRRVREPTADPRSRATARRRRPRG